MTEIEITEYLNQEVLIYARYWSPLFFLLQIASLLLLLRQASWRWQPGLVARRRFDRWLLQGGVTLAPIVMLCVSTTYMTDYQQQYGHWFFSIHDGLAGLVLVPFYAVASAVVWYGFWKPKFAQTSGVHSQILFILAGICIWHAVATLRLYLLTDGAGNYEILAVVPGIAAANYLLRAFEVRRHGRLQAPLKKILLGWYLALAVSLLAKVPLAMRLHASLPVERPEGYGDCFVVTAATGGHPGLVGSAYDERLGRVVNDQWRTLKAFEYRIAAVQPRFHRGLRRVYNVVGPRLAACIRGPMVADCAYLLLKPIEWLARLYLAATGRRAEPGSMR